MKHGMWKVGEVCNMESHAVLSFGCSKLELCVLFLLILKLSPF